MGFMLIGWKQLDISGAASQGLYLGPVSLA